MPVETTSFNSSPALIRGPKLGIDIGTVRIGVAGCGRDELVVLPLTTIRRDRRGGSGSVGGSDIQQIVALAREREVVEIVVGLPQHLGGTEGKSAKIARRFAQQLARALPEVHVCLLDERLTSVTAQMRLAEAGKNTREQRGIVDQVAAQIILETALETERRMGLPAGEQVLSKRR